MTSEERKEWNRKLRLLWQKLVQIIVQSRLGERTCTFSKSPTKGSVMFNLEIEDILEVSQEVKKSCGSQIVSPDKPFCIEILLRTKEGETMVLEVWTLSMDDLLEPTSSYNDPATYERMSSLLKSAICVSRITPAWKLSFMQGPESYVICYRIYTGEPQHDCLGDSVITNRIGQINVHIAHLTLQMSYRTKLTFPSPPRILNDQMMLKSDHFKFDSSPKHLRRIGERVVDSDNPETSTESQDVATSPLEFRSASPRSRTSSESSHRGSLSHLPTEKIYVPFATQKVISSDEYLSDLPLSNMIAAASVEKAEESMQGIKELKERRISESKLPKYTRSDKMNSSTHSNKSAASNVTKEDTDYVVVDLKTPLLGSFDTPDEGEFSNFYKGVIAAPKLKTFAEKNQDVMNVSEELRKFEIVADIYDDLVKSFNSDSQSSLEFG